MQKLGRIAILRQALARCKALSLLRQRRHHHQTSQLQHYSSPPPPGFLAVYIGAERRRFVIPTRYLNFPVFRALLKSAEEEFGFQAAGGLVLPCDPEFLGNVVDLLWSDEEQFRGLGVDGFVKAIRRLGFGGAGGRCGGGSDSLCRDEAAVLTALTPLLRKVRG